MMRILFTIPHFFKAEGGGGQGSTSPDPRPRVQALAACLAGLHQWTGRPQGLINHRLRGVVPITPSPAYEIDVVVCTAGDRHLLGQLTSLWDGLPIRPTCLYEHRLTRAEPSFLGFECQDVLRERQGSYDYYCYLEDDLVLHDPWFFVKLAWFTQGAGDRSLLQPYRYQSGAQGRVRKVYFDGDLAPEVTAPFQDVREQPELTFEVLGQPVSFRRALNPHAGCYFLSAGQMAYWAGQPFFGSRDARFIGPRESAATLGIMRTFRVYKPAPQNASFLEICHLGTDHLDQVGFALPLLPSQTELMEQYQLACQMPSDINEHLPTLYSLARECRHVTEMGTRTGISTTALLYAQPDKLVCYDLRKCPEVDRLRRLAGRTEFVFHEADVLKVEIEETDLLFIDTWHVYEQMKEELRLHAGKARKYIVLHDTTTFGERGETQGHRGVWPAVEEFLAQGTFRLWRRDENNNGLTILERVGP